MLQVVNTRLLIEISPNCGHYTMVIPFSRATVSAQRFKLIKSTLQFDNPQRRNRGDPLAPVRGILDEVSCQLKTNYMPGCFMTVDEQLVVFHG